MLSHARTLPVHDAGLRAHAEGAQVAGAGAPASPNGVKPAGHGTTLSRAMHVANPAPRRSQNAAAHLLGRHARTVSVSTTPVPVFATVHVTLPAGGFGVAET